MIGDFLGATFTLRILREHRPEKTNLRLLINQNSTLGSVGADSFVSDSYSPLPFQYTVVLIRYEGRREKPARYEVKL